MHVKSWSGSQGRTQGVGTCHCHGPLKVVGGGGGGGLNASYCINSWCPNAPHIHSSWGMKVRGSPHGGSTPGTRRTPVRVWLVSMPLVTFALSCSGGLSLSCPPAAFALCRSVTEQIRCRDNGWPPLPSTVPFQPHTKPLCHAPHRRRINVLEPHHRHPLLWVSRSKLIGPSSHPEFCQGGHSVNLEFMLEPTIDVLGMSWTLVALTQSPLSPGLLGFSNGFSTHNT